MPPIEAPITMTSGMAVSRWRSVREHCGDFQPHGAATPPRAAAPPAHAAAEEAPNRRANPAAQAEFVEQLPRQLAAIAAAHPDKQVRVYFEDEARFGQQGTLTHVWAQRGTRPTAVRQTEYGYLWVLGAVCPATGHAEGLLSPRLNTSVVNLFLEQFSGTLGADEHAVLIWDGAGFHTSGALRVPANVSVVQLPAYSPELNPVENL